MRIFSNCSCDNHYVHVGFSDTCTSLSKELTEMLLMVNRVSSESKAYRTTP